MLFAVIILFLVALLAWASIGQLETTAPAKAAVADGTAQITVLSGANVGSGMKVRMCNAEFTVSAVEEDEMGRTVAYAPVALANGTYDALRQTGGSC